MKEAGEIERAASLDREAQRDGRPTTSASDSRPTTGASAASLRSLTGRPMSPDSAAVSSIDHFPMGPPRGRRPSPLAGGSDDSFDGDAEPSPALPLLDDAADDAMHRIVEFFDTEKLKMVDLFRKLDADGSNSLDAAELQDFLAELGFVLDSPVAEKLIRVLDIDGDVTVQTAEFFERLRAIKRAHRPALTPGAKQRPGGFRPLPPAPRPSTPAEREHRAKIRARREAALDAKRQAQQQLASANKLFARRTASQRRGIMSARLEDERRQEMALLARVNESRKDLQRRSLKGLSAAYGATALPVIHRATMTARW